MRVERCPSCGAPYNVTTIAVGRGFACPRCGARVTVAEAAGEAGAPRRSAALAGLGVAMVLSLLLYAHPSIGLQPRWPWQHWTDVASHAHRADLLLWTAVGLLAVLAGAGALGRSGAAWVLAPAALLAIRCCVPRSALAVQPMSLVWMAATVALGAGFLARASRRPGAFRLLLLLGAAATLAVHAVHFADASGRSLLEQRTLAVRSWWERAALPQDAWRLHVPVLAQAGAVLLGLLLPALRASRRAGRVLAWLGFAGLLLTWILPAASVAAGAWEDVSRSPRKAAEIVALTWFREGLGLFLLGSLVVAAIAVRASDEPTATARLP